MEVIETKHRGRAKWTIMRKAQIIGGATGATVTLAMIGIGLLFNLLGVLEDDGSDTYSRWWEKMILPASKLLRICGLPEADLSISELVFQLVLIVIINAVLLLSLGTLIGGLLSRVSLRNPSAHVR